MTLKVKNVKKLQFVENREFDVIMWRIFGLNDAIGKLIWFFGLIFCKSYPIHAFLYNFLLKEYEYRKTFIKYTIQSGSYIKSFYDWCGDYTRSIWVFNIRSKFLFVVVHENIYFSYVIFNIVRRYTPPFLHFVWHLSKYSFYHWASTGCL